MGGGGRLYLEDCTPWLEHSYDITHNVHYDDIALVRSLTLQLQLIISIMACKNIVMLNLTLLELTLLRYSVVGQSFIALSAQLRLYLYIVST